MSGRRLLAAAAVLTVALSGCSVAHTARPLGKGRQAVIVSVGGPLAGVGDSRTPIPLVTATYKYGITDKLDVYAGWHVIETFLNDGNAYFDLGASYYFLDQKGALPGVSGAFTLSPLINKEGGWASFDLQATFSWAFGPRERSLLYLGFHNYFAPLVGNPTSAKSPYSFSPYLGAQVRIGKDRRFGLGGRDQVASAIREYGRLSARVRRAGQAGGHRICRRVHGVHRKRHQTCGGVR